MRYPAIICGLNRLKTNWLKSNVFIRLKRNKKLPIIKTMLNDYTVRVISSLSGLLHTSQPLLLRASAH